MSMGRGKPTSDAYSSAARLFGSATSENNTNRSMSLSGPASARAREPKRMILSGENRSAIRRTRSSRTGGLSATSLMGFMITRTAPTNLGATPPLVPAASATGQERSNPQQGSPVDARNFLKQRGNYVEEFGSPVWTRFELWQHKSPGVRTHSSPFATEPCERKR